MKKILIPAALLMLVMLTGCCGNLGCGAESNYSYSSAGCCAQTTSCCGSGNW